ncbi:hypothetical protein CIP107524_01915 [Corynebacterium diphtheriae]|nr:hypothetical protein CIP107524_01915 [Corynebacterium diphtheriae]
MFAKKKLEKINRKIMDLDTTDFQRLLTIGFADFCRANLRRPDVFISMVDGKILIGAINKEKEVENLETIIDYCQRLNEGRDRDK